MSGDKSLFTSLEKCDRGIVQFGDGGKSKIIVKGTVYIPGIYTFFDVFYMDGLKVNLLNMSRLCDTEYNVHFSLEECTIVDKKGKSIFMEK